MIPDCLTRFLQRSLLPCVLQRIQLTELVYVLYCSYDAHAVVLNLFGVATVTDSIALDTYVALHATEIYASMRLVDRHCVPSELYVLRLCNSAQSHFHDGNCWLDCTYHPCVRKNRVLVTLYATDSCDAMPAVDRARLPSIPRLLCLCNSPQPRFHDGSWYLDCCTERPAQQAG